VTLKTGDIGIRAAEGGVKGVLALQTVEWEEEELEGRKNMAQKKKKGEEEAEVT